MAAVAENFRSTCGSERGAPECSTQRFPAATPHVGHGTEDICLGVSSFFFIRTECDNTHPRNRPILNIDRIGRYPLGWRFLCCIEQRDQYLCEKILPIRIRASCLPESSRRALVADAREDSPVSDALPPHPEKRDGHLVRRASILCLRTPTSRVFGTRLSLCPKRNSYWDTSVRMSDGTTSCDEVRRLASPKALEILS